MIGECYNTEEAKLNLDFCYSVSFLGFNISTASLNELTWYFGFRDHGEKENLLVFMVIWNHHIDGTFWHS